MLRQLGPRFDDRGERPPPDGSPTISADARVAKNDDNAANAPTTASIAASARGMHADRSIPDFTDRSRFPVHRGKTPMQTFPDNKALVNRPKSEQITQMSAQIIAPSVWSRTVVKPRCQG